MTQTAQVMILGAGEGRRLLPLTLERPKPLMPVGDRPMLAHLLGQLSVSGYRRVVINTHHLAEQLHGFAPRSLEVLWSDEARLLGTAGGVAAARAHWRPPLLIYNADIYPPPPPEPMRGALGELAPVLLVRPRRDSSAGAAPVGLDAQGRVVRLRARRFGEEASQADYLGVMGLPEAVLERLPSEGCLIGDVCIPWLEGGGAVFSVASSDAWCDIGTLPGYYAANRMWLRAHGLDTWVAADAQVARAVRCVESLVGAGAVVEGVGLLERCVVWPGARVRAPLREAVVTSQGRVVRFGEV